MTINVIDDMAPTALCKPATVNLDENGGVVVAANLVDDASMDNCGITNYAVAPANFDCTHAGTTQVVTLTVTDAQGLSSTCTADVDVVDTGVNAPFFCGDTFIVELDATGNGSFIINDLPTVMDNCTGDLFVFTASGLDPTYDCSSLGTNTVTLTYGDQNFTFETCDVTVEVTDPSSSCVIEMVTNDSNTEVATSTSLTTGEEDEQTEEDYEIQLTENEAIVSLSRVNVYPNPFAVRTTVEYHLNTPAHTEITVWDATGRQLEQLLSGVMSSGKHRTTWTPGDLPQGLYLIRIQVENEPAKVVRVNYN